MMNSLLFLAAVRVLTLSDAVQTAQRLQPQLVQAHAQTDAAFARADEARAPILPQLTGNASYQRTTANFTLRPGLLPSNINDAARSFKTSNFFNFGLTLSQFIWDFGQTTDKWSSAKATADAQKYTESATQLQVLLTVRNAFFTARAQKALVEVARDTLANQERHLQQVTGFVEVGTRPAIDLAQARLDRANAQVQLITAENGYETAKAQLNQAIGVEGPTDYDVGDDTLGEVAGENLPIDDLVNEALKTRPEFAAIERQLRAQELSVRASRGGYFPAIGASTALTYAGTQISNLVWNWNATGTLTWQLFNGLLTPSQVHEAKANLTVVGAQRDLLRQQVRLEVDQARLSVRAAKAALGAAEDALTNALVRLRLAEGRYQTGIGSIIELGDAQVARTTAAAQRVQADYNLAIARAQLQKALGRS